MGIMKFNYFILFVSIALTTNICFAQSAKDTIEVVEIGKQKYYIHTVEAGHTLYAISKRYNTPIDVIKDANPGIEAGLSIGQKIKIPVKKIPKRPLTQRLLS
jgi:LysM repeat protein